jgi:predicted Zn finger-like uncharacterized protein
MILTCPACGTQYVVKDGAIPEGGRKVRCASCRHSWHQEPPPLELGEAVGVELSTGDEEFAAAAAAPDLAARVDPVVGDAGEQPGDDSGYGEDDEPAGDGRTAAEMADADETAYGTRGSGDALKHGEPADEPVAFVTPREVEPEPAEFAVAPADDDFSPFGARDPVERKRRGPLLAMLVIFILVAAAAAAFWFLAPAEWRSRVGIAESRQTPLQLMMTHSDRQALASGNELLAVSGRVINPTTKVQPVPPIQAELRSKTGDVVYRWTIAPPTPTLAPGASARFNSAEVNVPAGGEELTVSLGAPGA